MVANQFVSLLKKSQKDFIQRKEKKALLIEKFHVAKAVSFFFS